MHRLLPILLVLAALPAAAQAPAPQQLPTPVDPDAIVLHAPAQPAAQAAQWESWSAGRMARNVTVSTLTPFLPDPAKATGAAVIVAPGGAFLMLSMDSEGYQVARWLASRGIAAFVLKYRVRPTAADTRAFLEEMAAFTRSIPELKSKPGGIVPPDAAEDARAALKLVRSRAAQWHVDPARVGFVGFSAGAILTLVVGLDPDAALRPNFIAPIYGPPGALTVPPDAPPMFFALAADDPLFGKDNFDLIQSWRAAGRPIEFHLYEHGGHGFGMNPMGTTSDLWIEEFYTWMQDRGELKAK
jgi:acetyl esterase/lipase